MSSLSASLYTSLASGESARQAYSAQLRAQEELIGNQLRATLSPQPGSTITARYEYKVGSDGTLYPTQTQITAEAPSGRKADDATDEKRGGNFQRTLARGRAAPRFADFSPIRAVLSPLDELALYGEKAEGQAAPTPEPTQPEANFTATNASPANALSAQAAGEDGKPITVEVLPPGTGSAANDNTQTPPTSLDARRQFAAATLYARNNDVIYNGAALSQLAA